MFGYPFRGTKIDFRDVELSLTCLLILTQKLILFIFFFVIKNWLFLKLGFVAFDPRIDFYTQIYSLTHYSWKVLHKCIQSEINLPS